MLSRIISGGQTGVDRAALDAALEYNFPCGGWCPKGRLAEDGIISQKYPLKETESSEYEVRTKLNVRGSDGTLILTWGKPTGGTTLTVEFAKQYTGSPAFFWRAHSLKFPSASLGGEVRSTAYQSKKSVISANKESLNSLTFTVHLGCLFSSISTL